jgi:hypothetical protein
MPLFSRSFIIMVLSMLAGCGLPHGSSQTAPVASCESSQVYPLVSSYTTDRSEREFHSFVAWLQAHAVPTPCKAGLNVVTLDFCGGSDPATLIKIVTPTEELRYFYRSDVLISTRVQDNSAPEGICGISWYGTRSSCPSTDRPVAQTWCAKF